MKQHITTEDLNQLSEKGEKRLREWWKSEEGDWYFVPKGIQYGSGYGHWAETLWREDTVCCLGMGELGGGSGGNVRYAGKIKFDAINYGEYGDDNYFDIPIKSVYPLLSIGQMIEFLDETKPPTEPMKLEIVNDKVLKAIEWPFEKELCDALWRAVKEVLEKNDN